ncbi:hypothetical protein H0H87_001331 [Tephrocybe sp. NHM501043]|nr:hypothetical protein H0H87_001331 [Tephrocybe sp. NHM501043]
MAQRPFIPPLPTFGSTANTPVALNPPVIPDAPVDGPEPGWAARGMHGGSFPIYPPSSPFVPGFIPPPPPIGSTPSQPHTGLPPVRPPPSAEYSGYPGGPPQGPWSAPVQPGPGWGHPRAPYAQYPPQQQSGIPYPGFGNPYPPHQGAWPQAQANPYGAPPPGWGVPVNPAATPMIQTIHHTPHPTPGYGMINFDAWNAPFGPLPAWPQPLGQQAAANQRNEVPEYLYARRQNDRVDPFTAGPSYGPVLDPFQIALLGVQARINPLLGLPIDDPNRPYLKWNMLFRSNDCSRSTDEAHISWSVGRDEPATFPRVTVMKIVSETFPWSIEVKAGNETLGVTCGDVIETLAESFYQLTSEADYEALTPKRKNEVGAVYLKNRSREVGVPGGALKQGLRRLDFLGSNNIFGGIRSDDLKAHKILGSAPPCTYVLICSRQYVMTAKETLEYVEKQRVQEDKEREERDHERRKKTEEEERHRMTSLNRAMNRATVEDDVDSDSDSGRPD